MHNFDKSNNVAPFQLEKCEFYELSFIFPLYFGRSLFEHKNVPLNRARGVKCSLLSVFAVTRSRCVWVLLLLMAHFHDGVPIGRPSGGLPHMIGWQRRPSEAASCVIGRSVKLPRALSYQKRPAVWAAERHFVCFGPLNTSSVCCGGDCGCFF